MSGTTNWRETNLKIGIDVDLTWLDSGLPWLDWLTLVHGCEPDWALIEEHGENGGLMEYNLTKYFPPLSETQISGYDYFEDPFLYDKIQPLPGAVDAVRQLVSEGDTIHFISLCKKGHFSSKVRHLKRHTQDFMSLEPGSGHGFYATKNKGMIAVDVMIDDRHDMLNQFGDNVVKILFKTPYKQSEELKFVPDLITNDWAVILEFLQGIK